MPERYIISKCNDGWVVSVDGAMLLICERKRAAVRAVRDATANDPTATMTILNGDTEPGLEMCGPMAAAS